MKLTLPQRQLLQSIADSARPVWSGYKPAMALVRLGLAVWQPAKYENDSLAITDAGRAENVKMSEPGPKYPRLAAIGIAPVLHPSGSFSYVPGDELNLELRRRGIEKRFGELFGAQTVSDLGPYPGDVEAVLERLSTGRLIGSQLDWD